MSNKFPLGNILATPGATALLASEGVLPIDLLKRHASGDWGVVGEEDWKANDNSVEDESRILSAYLVGEEKVWIITEADRSATTLLLPSEY